MPLPVYVTLPWLPLPRRYTAITLVCLVLVRKGHDSDRLRLHEHVHWEQWKELWIIGFLVLYLGYFIRGLFKHRSWDKAYLNIPFEREARASERIIEHYQIRHREPFHWLKYRD